MWLHKVWEINFIILWIAVLYSNSYPYYLNENKGIDLFVLSIITIVTGIYDSRWRVFSRPRLPAIARKYMVQVYGGSLGLLRVGRTARRPSAVKQRGMECRCLARHNIPIDWIFAAWFRLSKRDFLLPEPKYIR